jgi:hypothetical protein
VVLEVAREIPGGELEAAGQLGCAHPLRQLEQRKRVPARLGEDARADAVVDPAGQGPRQKRAGIGVAQAADRELGQAIQLVHVA